LGLVWRWGQGGLSREEDVWKEDEKAQETSKVFEYAPIIETVLGSILGVRRVNKSGALQEAGVETPMNRRRGSRTEECHQSPEGSATPCTRKRRVGREG